MLFLSRRRSFVLPNLHVITRRLSSQQNLNEPELPFHARIPNNASFPPRNLSSVCPATTADGILHLDTVPDVLRWLQVAAAAVFSSPLHGLTYARSTHPVRD